MLLYTPAYQSWGWRPPFRAPRAVLIAYFLSNVFLIAFPFAPPEKGRQPYIHLPYWVSISLLCSVMQPCWPLDTDLVTSRCRLLRSVYWSCLLVLFRSLGASEERLYIGQGSSRSGRWRAAAYFRAATSRSYRPSISGTIIDIKQYTWAGHGPRLNQWLPFSFPQSRVVNPPPLKRLRGAVCQMSNPSDTGIDYGGIISLGYHLRSTLSLKF